MRLLYGFIAMILFVALVNAFAFDLSAIGDDAQFLALAIVAAGAMAGGD